MALAIRPATSADLQALHALVESAYRGDSARAGWTHEADLLGGQRTDIPALTAILEAPGELILLAEAGSTLAGCVHLKPAARARTVYLGLFAVAPDLQAGGIGRQVLVFAEDHAFRAMDATRIEMTVIRQRAELIAWYERRGYRLTGEARPFPMDDPRFGTPSRRDLAFVVMEKALGTRKR